MSKTISTPIDVAAAREQFVGLGKSYPPHPDVQGRSIKSPQGAER